jgi:hypothetical protein
MGKVRLSSRAIVQFDDRADPRPRDDNAKHRLTLCRRRREGGHLGARLHPQHKVKAALSVSAATGARS